MLIATLILLMPVVVYLATFVPARRLKTSLRKLYRLIGAVLVIGGGTTSYYLAAYTGDQGGIAAFYFQLLVMAVYVLFSVGILIANVLLNR